MSAYAGIGSQSTPPDILDIMVEFGIQLAERGLTLRSGYANGADTAFWKGASYGHGKQENYIPWPGFNGAPANDNRFISLNDLPDDVVMIARDLARHTHPAWHSCSQGVRKLHTRNMFQVLGRNLDDPVDFVVCWTKNGSGAGGTGQALRLAKSMNIQIFDLAIPGMIDALHSYIENEYINPVGLFD